MNIICKIYPHLDGPLGYFKRIINSKTIPSANFADCIFCVTTAQVSISVYSIIQFELTSNVTLYVELLLSLLYSVSISIHLDILPFFSQSVCVGSQLQSKVSLARSFSKSLNESSRSAFIESPDSALIDSHSSRSRLAPTLSPVTGTNLYSD